MMRDNFLKNRVINVTKKSIKIYVYIQNVVFEFFSTGGKLCMIRSILWI